MNKKVLKIHRGSTMEDKIRSYYRSLHWFDNVRNEGGVNRCFYSGLDWFIVFDSEAHKTWFILRWS